MVNERLRRARTSRGEELSELAARTGLREGVLRAIEDGRYELLPAGIYARAAIRSYSAAVGLDPEEMLDACAPELPAVAEPISAIGRLRGIRTAPEAPIATTGSIVLAVAAAKPDWRLVAAAAVDATVVGALLLVVIALARVAMAAPLATLGGTGALSFAVMGSILASSYFAWFAVSGSTAGAKALGLGRRSVEPDAMTLQSVGRRALRCATDDLRFVAEAGTWIGAAFRARECHDAHAECRAGALND
jgi:transcriptional regulator with XRE-family HTH domain